MMKPPREVEMDHAEARRLFDWLKSRGVHLVTNNGPPRWEAHVSFRPCALDQYALDFLHTEWGYPAVMVEADPTELEVN